MRTSPFGQGSVNRMRYATQGVEASATTPPAIFHQSKNGPNECEYHPVPAFGHNYFRPNTRSR